MPVPVRVSLILICLSLITPLVASGADVQLDWPAVTTNADGSPIADLSGYYVHQGTSPGSYGPATFLGLTTTALITDVPQGTYYFAVTAADTSGNISGYSPEASVTVTDHSEQLMLAPTADTFINLDAVNYSTQPLLNTYTWPANKVANAILMKFSLAALPANAVVQSAVLFLALVESDEAGGTYTVTLHKVINRNPNLAQATGYRLSSSQTWKANGCCYNKIPMAQANIGPIVASLAVDDLLGQKSWLMTSLIHEWRAQPSTNFGLLLNSDATQPADRYRFFASRDDPDVARRPALVMTYTLP